jgi:hypothetical protein
MTITAVEDVLRTLQEEIGEGSLFTVDPRDRSTPMQRPEEGIWFSPGCQRIGDVLYLQWRGEIVKIQVSKVDTPLAE